MAGCKHHNMSCRTNRTRMRTLEQPCVGHQSAGTGNIFLQIVHTTQDDHTNRGHDNHIHDSSTITPDTTTITTTQDLCQPTARKLVREAARDDISGRNAPALPRADSPSLGLQGRTASSSVANIQILGTSEDKRPSIWRLFAADALIKACSCLGIPGAPVTVTTTSTATAFEAAAQVTTTTTTTITLPVPTLYSEATQFRLVTNTNHIFYLQSGSGYWFFQDYTPTTDSPGLFLYKIQDSILRSSTGDCLRANVRWGGHNCMLCNLDANLQLDCNMSFYERAGTGAGDIVY